MKPAQRPLKAPLIASGGLVLVLAALLPHIAPAHFQVALAVPALGLNSLCFGLFLARARWHPEERKGWWLLAASMPILLVANVIMGQAGHLDSAARTLDWVWLTLNLLVGLLHGWAILSWPWREAPAKGPRGLDLTGALLFSSSIMLLFWLVGVWQASVQGRAVIHTRVMALALRVALTSGPLIYVFSKDPRRIRGALGWMLVALGGLGLSVLLFLPLVPSGGAMPGIPPWFSLPILTPLGMAFAAWSRQRVEVDPQAPRLRLPLLELVQYVPYLLAAAALGGGLLHHRGPLTGPLLAVLGVTSLLIQRQVLLHRQVKAENLLLEDRVVQRTQSMEKMQAVLLRTERMNAMATLGAGLAHDLNNLLGVIQIHAGLLQAEAGASRGARDQGFRRILEATGKARQFTSQMMTFGRRQGPADHEALQPLAEVVPATRQLLEMLLPRNIAFQMEVDAATPAVLVKPMVLEQVLVNLVSNAKDAMPGGGRLRVTLRPGPGEAAILEVKDSGPGIPLERQELVFEPFFTTKAEDKGTGLGLPMVRTIMEAHGGRVELDSQPGQGTTFRLTFPVDRVPEPAPPAPMASQLVVETPTAPPQAGTRPLPVWLWGVILLTLVWTLWLAQLPSHSTLHGAMEIGLPLGLAGFAAATLGRATLREDLPRVYRGAFKWMAAGLAVVSSASLYVLVTEVLIPHAEGILPLGLADLLFMSAYPLILIGQLRLPKAGASRLGRWRFLADSAVLVSGVAMPLWILALRPSLGTLHGMEALVSLGFPALAFTGIFITNAVLIRATPLPSRRAFNLILGGLAISWIADLVFALHVTQGLHIPNLGHLANAINALSLLSVGVGAWWLRTDPVQPRGLKPVPYSPIPLLTISVVSLWMVRFLQVFTVTPGTLSSILGYLIIMVFALLLREGLAARHSYRHASEAVTSALSARFEALVKHATDLIMVIDPQGRLRYASPGAVPFLDAGPGGVLDLPLERQLHPEDVEGWRDFLAELATQPVSRLTGQWRMRTPGGEWRQFEVTGRNLLEDPDVAGLVINAWDITDRRALESQLFQEMKMGALGRLAGGMAHDFNNLLGAILGNVELASLSASDPPRLQERLGRIQEAAGRMGALTGRLLSFSRRPGNPQAVLEPQDVLAGCLQRLQAALGGAIDLKVAVEQDAWSLEANPEDLFQTLLALAQNARDAMPDGGSFTLSLRNAETPDSDQRLFLLPGTGPYLLLELEDTGHGMDAQVLGHLFEPFFSTKGQMKGVGLGLIGVYGFMNACQGGIGIRSAPGKGTTVSLWFPRVSPRRAPAPQPLPAPTLEGSESILLVEDEEAVREAVRELLDSFGYQVFEAGNADQARAFLARHPGPLDLLVTDVMMPGDSGPKLAAEVVKTRPDLRVLYISGYTADELQAHGLAHPGAMLLGKPFTRDQLGRKIRESLAVQG